MGADLEFQPLESNLAGGRTEVEDYVGSRDCFVFSPWGHIIGTNGCHEGAGAGSDGPQR